MLNQIQGQSQAPPPKIKTKSRIFNISSSSTNTLNGPYKSSVQISLPDLSFHNTESAYLSILHAEIPNSFYNVNYTNNILVVNSISYTIPVGNYNASTLITAILLLIPNTFSITYSSTSNKYTFSNSTTDFIVNSNSTISSIIGLGTSSLSSTFLTLILPYIVNFRPLPRINFKSNFFKFNSFNDKDKSSDLILSIQNNGQSNGMIYYTASTDIKFKIDDPNVTSFALLVCDDAGNFINFNNQDWYLTFLIDINYYDINNPNINFNSLRNGFF